MSGVGSESVWVGWNIVKKKHKDWSQRQSDGSQLDKKEN